MIFIFKYHNQININYRKTKYKFNFIYNDWYIETPTCVQNTNVLSALVITGYNCMHVYPKRCLYGMMLRILLLAHN